MNKNELAVALAEALNILNGVQSELPQSYQGAIHALFATIPKKTLDACDFNNNGSVDADDLIKGK